MPRAAAAPSLQDTGRRISALLVSCMQFVARERGEATVRKWLSRHNTKEISEGRMVAMAADAMLLSADLLLSQPSVSGTTAFDRLARNRAGAPPAEKAAIGLLCESRFRLLRLEETRTRARSWCAMSFPARGCVSSARSCRHWPLERCCSAAW